MTNGIILAKKSTWTSRLDLNYLDETSLRKRSEYQDMSIGDGLDQFSDYASKEDLGSVHVSGFLHNRVALNPDGSFTHPANLDNEERKRRIAEEWRKMLKEPVHGKGAKKDVIQHRLVFSMSTEMHAACLEKCINPEAVLHRSMSDVMKRFGEQFHRGDRIGYAYGFHHDTKHLHVHVSLCPRTAKGNYVGFSTPRDKVNNVSRNKDHFGFVHQCCAKENRKWDRVLGNEQKLEQVMDQRHANQWLVSPQFSRQQFEQSIATCDVKGVELREMYDTMKKLHRRMEAIKAEQRQAALDRAVATLFPSRGLKPAIREAQKQRNRELKDLRRRFCRLRTLYLNEHRRHSQQPQTKINYAHYLSRRQQREQRRQQQQTQRQQPRQAPITRGISI